MSLGRQHVNLQTLSGFNKSLFRMTNGDFGLSPKVLRKKGCRMVNLIFIRSCIDSLGKPERTSFHHSYHSFDNLFHELLGNHKDCSLLCSQFCPLRTSIKNVEGHFTTPQKRRIYDNVYYTICFLKFLLFGLITVSPSRRVRKYDV